MKKVETLRKATKGDAQAKYNHAVHKLEEAAGNPKRVSEKDFQQMMQDLRSRYGKQPELPRILEAAVKRRKDALAKFGPAGGLKAVACAKLGVKTAVPGQLCNAVTKKVLNKQPKSLVPTQKRDYSKLKQDVNQLLQLAKNPKRKPEYDAMLQTVEREYAGVQDKQTKKLVGDLIKRAKRARASVAKPTNSDRDGELSYKHDVQKLFNIAKLGREDGAFEKQLARIAKYKTSVPASVTDPAKKANIVKFISQRIEQAQKVYQSAKSRNQQKVRDKKATRLKQEQQRLAKQQKLEEQKRMMEEQKRMTEEQRKQAAQQKKLQRQERAQMHTSPMKRTMSTAARGGGGLFRRALTMPGLSRSRRRR